MRLKHFVAGIVCAVSFGLSYTWQQVEIIKLAYQGGRANKIYKEVLDKNRYLRYNLLNLKSSSALGQKLLDENSLYEIPNGSQVLSLVLPKNTPENQSLALAGSRNKQDKDSFLLGALKMQSAWPISLVSSYLNNQAQAQDLTSNNK